ncbi:MAG: superoxide dismutase [Planctomycetes bacterium]|nr:superoxide dismutase [Planctomycetota bacterium]
MKRQLLALFVIVGVVTGTTMLVLNVRTPIADAHCQVPCGIYDDDARVTRLKEDAATIEKATKNINQLAGKNDAQSFNQAARWVATKEAHASHIIEVISEYFMAQRVKPVASGADGYDAYVSALTKYHAVMVAAMKAKQHADQASCDALKSAIDALP